MFESFLCFLSVEGMKVIEIEMCKKEISEIKNQIYDAQKKMVDYTRLRLVYIKLKVRSQ